MTDAIQIYTDGSYKHLQKKGGFGVVFILGKRMKKYHSRSFVDTTNVRMEIRGVIHALEKCNPGHTIDIYCDNEHVINMANEWLDNNIANNTMSSKANIDLWRKFYLARKVHLDGKSKLKFIWIRGHAGNPFNEMADKLATKASRKGKPIICKRNTYT